MVSFSYGQTLSAAITRPTNTTPYTANDAWANSATAPTVGGFYLGDPAPPINSPPAAKGPDRCGLITDIVFVSSVDPATLLQGELWLFDSAITAVNDNAAFAISDANMEKFVGRVAFTLASTVAGTGTSSFAHVRNLNLGYRCVGSDRLRFLVKVKNAYTPASAEKLSIRAKVLYTS